MLIFGESSHWDPNWLFDSDQYFQLRIRPIMDAVLDELHGEPRRIYSVESLFFIKLYWERRAKNRQALRQLINQGRLRLTGTGLTTPDTNLPALEAILRDYQLGQQWLRDNGMTVEPRLAYLPDSFGYAPTMPAIFKALGYESVGICRIDGMYFIGADLRPKTQFPLSGSSADQLQRKQKTLDFIWQAPDGAEVLCHWNAFSYFQGDMLAHRGIIRWMGLPLCLPWRTERHVARRIRGFVQQLDPLARTPYLYCPIGCDFTEPIADLVKLLDRYNQRRYPDTGVWVINAGMDDYMDLVSCHRQALPVFQLDPNPYWMGFYASRPAIKQKCNRTAHKLGLAEALLTAGDDADERPDEIRAAWEQLAVANHHDFITGTSPDRVWRAEQEPWLERAESLTDSILERAKKDHPPTPTERLHVDRGGSVPSWSLSGGRLRVTTEYYRLVLSEQDGGHIVELRDTASGKDLLIGPGNELVRYHDSGGLWRMGHEFRGGLFRPTNPRDQRPAVIEAMERDGQLAVSVSSRLRGRPVVRWIWLRNDSPVMRMRLTGSAARRYTVACRFPTGLDASALSMDVPGAVVERPMVKLYDPTFWPARSFVHVRDPHSDRGMAVILGGPACVSLGPGGSLQWVVLRNVPREVAFRVVPIVAHPAAGTDGQEHGFDYAVVFTRSGDYLDNDLPRLARQVLADIWLPLEGARLGALTASLVSTDHPHVMVTAMKAADHGPGRIVRLVAHRPNGSMVRLRAAGRSIARARLCDARERDLTDLEVDDDAVLVPLAGAITSVRLVLGSDHAPDGGE